MTLPKIKFSKMSMKGQCKGRKGNLTSNTGSNVTETMELPSSIFMS
jgi:hypothetical protein